MKSKIEVFHSGEWIVVSDYIVVNEATVKAYIMTRTKALDWVRFRNTAKKTTWRIV